jgi:hypothetical protein
MIAEGKGRCLVAGGAIPAGELIEVAPTLIIDRAERDHVDRTTLTDYYFNLGRTTARTDLHNFDGCLALGVATLCNHSPDPNAECVVLSTDEGFFFLLSSLRTIAQGEEICIRYRDPWFEYRPPTSQGERVGAATSCSGHT